MEFERKILEQNTVKLKTQFPKYYKDCFDTWSGLKSRTPSLTNGRGSWVVGKSRGSWVWVVGVGVGRVKKNNEKK